ncbi:MAG: hypothetical protein RJQ09_15105 [Cyclobacteriaceae bacterium]
MALEEDESAEEIVETGEEIKKKVDEAESKLVSPKQETFQDIINFRNMIDRHLIHLKDLIDSNVPPLTSGEKDRFEDLDQDWSEVKKEVDQILNSDLPAFNKLLRESDIQHVAPKEKKEEKVGS